MLRKITESELKKPAVEDKPVVKDKPQPTALANHAKFFSDGTGKFTAESMEQGMRRLGGQSAESARSVSLITMNSASRKGCPYAGFFGGGHFTSSDLPKLIHPEDTGIFTKSGEFNPEAFNQLKKYATEDKQSGQQILSREQLRQFKQTDSHQERWSEAGCFTKMMSGFASDGEFDLLYDSLADVERNGTKYISIPRLERFYTDGESLFDEVAKSKSVGPK